MKIRIKFALHMPWRLIGHVEVELHSFLTSAVYGGEWSASCHDHFTSREGAPPLATEQ